MLIYMLHLVLGALAWAEMDDIPESERRSQIGRCWGVLALRHLERRGVRLTVWQSLAFDAKYCWRGYDGKLGGGVVGL